MYCQIFDNQKIPFNMNELFFWIVSGLFQALPKPPRSANHPYVTCLLVVAGELFPVSCGC